MGEGDQVKTVRVHNPSTRNGGFSSPAMLSLMNVVTVLLVLEFFKRNRKSEC